jgi:hypothetical protein
MKYTVGPYNSTCHQHAWIISITTNLVYVSPLQEKFRSVQSPGELKVMDCFLFGKALRFILHPVAEEKPILNTIHRPTLICLRFPLHTISSYTSLTFQTISSNGETSSQIGFHPQVTHPLTSCCSCGIDILARSKYGACNKARQGSQPSRLQHRILSRP